MFKVIVVDDEPPILNTIAKMIEYSHNSFKVIGKALNGEDALVLIKDLKPDVVFTDVKMPVMDGLQLIENLKNCTPRPISVILSGYKEFEYAKKALNYGATDYLIKPLNLNVLKSLLSDISNKLYQAKRDREMTTLEYIIKNATLPESSIDFVYEAFTCVLLCAGSYCTYHSSSLTPGKDFWVRNTLENILHEQFSHHVNFWVLDGVHENEKFVIFGSYLNSDNELECIPDKLVTLLDSYELPITIAATDTFESIVLLGTKIRNLQNALKKYIVFGLSQLIRENKYDKITRKEPEEIIIPSWESFFTKLILDRQDKTFKQNIKSLLNICENKQCCQFILEKILQEIYALFCKKVDQKNSYKLIDIHMELNEIISNAPNYQILFESLSCLADELFDSGISGKKDTEENYEILKKIDKYIESNFSKPINLKTLSEKFGFAPQYLGRKYKKLKGITPNDFIIQLRVEKAKELLRNEPTISIKEIAESVGYEDPFYLSRIFKLVTGISPSDFRNISRT